jgi:hypothetical protein
METQPLRARAELCRRLLQISKRPDVRQALAALLREHEEAAAAMQFQRRACDGFPRLKLRN